MAYRFKTRSATPTEYALIEAALVVVADIAANQAGMTDATTILGLTGTLDLATYVLIANVANKKYVLEEHNNYVGGEAGTLTLCAAADVWHTAADYGVVGELLDPVMVGSDIANCTVGNVKKDVVIDDVTGTYDPIAAAVFPAEANVEDTETAWGPTGAEYAGTLNIDSYVLIANVVAETWVVVGHDNYVGGTPGEYPTIATSQAAQLATDKDAVTAGKASLKDDTTILTIDGTYDFTTAIAAGYASGEADQLVIDKAAVDTGKAGIKDNTTILTVTGTYDFATAISDAEAAQLATDATAIDAIKAYILETQTSILGLVDGTLSVDYVTTDVTGGGYYRPNVNIVKLSETFGIGNAEVGTYNPTTPPTAPTVTWATGSNAVTATIDGDAGATNYVRYKASGATAWSSDSRSGDGDITVSSLENGVVYIFECYSEDAAGNASLSTPAVTYSFTADAACEFDEYLEDTADVWDVMAVDVTIVFAAGGTRSIKAIIDDGEKENVVGGLTEVILMDVRNNSTYGLTPGEVDLGRDKVTLLNKHGDEQTRLIKDIISRDAGRVIYEII